MITISQWNIAKKMICESYGLVFGTNSFIALVMQSLLTLIVTDSSGLGLNVRQQAGFDNIPFNNCTFVFFSTTYMHVCTWQ
jgi:thiamine transporter 2/3